MKVKREAYKKRFQFGLITDIYTTMGAREKH